MSLNEITAGMLSRNTLIASDVKLLGEETFENYGGEHQSVSPKFDSVGALLAWQWSLDSGQDDDCGDAQYGNGWHALFRSERLVLHTGNSGFVTAWRIPDDEDMDAAWAEIEAGAVTETDDEE